MISVTLISHSEAPMRSLYMAYRTCYSQLTPQQVLKRIGDDRITDAEMRRFIEERLKTGHASPLEQISFEFAISGVSRAFSHQFVRHRVGISFEQQSQRYVTYKEGEFPYTVPETVRKAGLESEMADLFGQVSELYEKMVAAGVPAEDARFLLPNATNTNFKITVNFQALLHICDLRLCTRAQWEFRKVAALMRAAVVKAVPELGGYLQPKCGELRMGYCDESEK
ncbi:thymidylate synthase, partial [bacterium SCGC AG-212-C10]